MAGPFSPPMSCTVRSLRSVSDCLGASRKRRRNGFENECRAGLLGQITPLRYDYIGHTLCSLLIGALAALGVPL